VPSNPPPIIKICAIAEDYVGNESSQCGEFVTGNKWEGTMHSETTGNYGFAGTCTGEAWDFDLYLVVGGAAANQRKDLGSGNFTIHMVCKSCK